MKNSLRPCSSTLYCRGLNNCVEAARPDHQRRAEPHQEEQQDVPVRAHRRCQPPDHQVTKIASFVLSCFPETYLMEWAFLHHAFM